MDFVLYCKNPKINDEKELKNMYDCVGKLNMDLNKLKEIVMKDVHFILTIDISNSMDEPVSKKLSSVSKLQRIISTIRGCINYLNNQINQTNQTIYISIITFSSKANTIISFKNICDFNDNDITNILNYIDVSERNQTNIENALLEIKKLTTIITYKHKQNSINNVNIILTDGYINSGADTTDELSKYMNEEQYYNFIGIGENHDYIILKELAEINPLRAMNYYIENTDNIELLYADIISSFITPSVFNIVISQSQSHKETIKFFNNKTGMFDCDNLIISNIKQGEQKYFHFITSDPSCNSLKITYDIHSLNKILTKEIKKSIIIYQGNNSNLINLFEIRSKVIELMIKTKDKIINDIDDYELGNFENNYFNKLPLSMSVSSQDSHYILDYNSDYDDDNESINEFECESVCSVLSEQPSIVRTKSNNINTITNTNIHNKDYLLNTIKKLQYDLNNYINDNKINNDNDNFINKLCDMLYTDLDFSKLSLNSMNNNKSLLCICSRINTELYQSSYSLNDINILKDDLMFDFNNDNKVNTLTLLDKDYDHIYDVNLVTKPGMYNFNNDNLLINLHSNSNSQSPFISQNVLNTYNDLKNSLQSQMF